MTGGTRAFTKKSPKAVPAFRGIFHIHFVARSIGWSCRLFWLSVCSWQHFCCRSALHLEEVKFVSLSLSLTFVLFMSCISYLSCITILVVGNKLAIRHHQFCLLITNNHFYNWGAKVLFTWHMILVQLTWNKNLSDIDFNILCFHYQLHCTVVVFAQKCE